MSEGTLSIECLRRALRNITGKHAVLRTSLQVDPVCGNLIQYIQPNDTQDWFMLHTHVIEDDSTLTTIFMDELTNRSHFDLYHGRVGRCHIVRHSATVANDDDVLSVGDWIVFNFHHVAFDGESEQILLDDLQKFYTHEKELQVTDAQATLQYIDCEFS